MIPPSRDTSTGSDNQGWHEGHFNLCNGWWLWICMVSKGNPWDSNAFTQDQIKLRTIGSVIRWNKSFERFIDHRSGENYRGYTDLLFNKL